MTVHKCGYVVRKTATFCQPDVKECFVVFTNRQDAIEERNRINKMLKNVNTDEDGVEHLFHVFPLNCELWDGEIVSSN